MYTGENDKDIEFEAAGVGEHICQLTKVKGLEINPDDVVKMPVWKNGIKTDQMRDVIRFVFKVGGKDNCYIIKNVTATTSARGGLFAMIQQLTDDWRKLDFNEKGYGEPSDFKTILMALQGKMFKVKVATNEYGYTGYASAKPSDEIPPVAPEPKAITKEEQPPLPDDSEITFDDFDEDDIPF